MDSAGSGADDAIKVVISTTETLHPHMHQYRQALAMEGVRVTTTARAGEANEILASLLGQRQSWVIYAVVREDLDAAAIKELEDFFGKAGQTDQRFCATGWQEDDPLIALEPIRAALESLRVEHRQRFPGDPSRVLEKAVGPSPAPRQPDSDRSWVAPAAIGGVVLVAILGLVVIGLLRRPAPEEEPAEVTTSTDTGGEEQLLSTEELLAGGETGEVPPVEIEERVPPPDRPPRAEELAVAQEAGTVVALDEFLCSTLTPSALTYDLAERHCKELEVASVGGWKLPSEAQARALMKSKKIPEASIWLTAPDDAAGVRAPLFDLKARRGKVARRSQRAAQAVCVRSGPPAQPDE